MATVRPYQSQKQLGPEADYNKPSPVVFEGAVRLPNKCSKLG